MARIKPAGSKKARSTTAADIRGALPCFIIVLAGIAILMIIFYFSLQSAGTNP